MFCTVACKFFVEFDVASREGPILESRRLCNRAQPVLMAAFTTNVSYVLPAATYFECEERPPPPPFSPRTVDLTKIQ